MSTSALVGVGVAVVVSLVGVVSIVVGVAVVVSVVGVVVIVVDVLIVVVVAVVALVPGKLRNTENTTDPQRKCEL